MMSHKSQQQQKKNKNIHSTGVKFIHTNYNTQAADDMVQ